MPCKLCIVRVDRPTLFFLAYMQLLVCVLLFNPSFSKMRLLRYRLEIQSSIIFHHGVFVEQVTVSIG